MIIGEDDATILIDLIGDYEFDLFNQDGSTGDSKIVLKADIEISNKDTQTISYTLFYGSLIDLDPNLILRLYEYQHALGERAIFIPRILTFECTSCPEEIK